MASRIIFTVNIVIDDEKLDNPNWWSKDGFKISTKKSIITKYSFLECEDKLINNQRNYAKLCGADYEVMGNDKLYKKFYKNFRKNYPHISDYDIINFYKHHCMFEFSKKYDEVCYFDLDVIVNTEENIFEAHDIYNKFACGEQNSEALYGKTVRPNEYLLCIRNPASKYWNCFALLLDAGYSKEESDTDVFNTGIMVASSGQIKKLDYFNNLYDILEDMKYLKEDTSLFHPNIVRSFNYDNETIFAFKRVVNNIDIDYINEDWHQRVLDDFPYIEDSKIFHVINKKFGLFDHILDRDV